MNLINETPKKSIVFEDDKVLVALAYEPITEGHCVVIWKEEKEDLSKLNTEDYEYLMDMVDVVRDMLIKFYDVEKVYLMYLDECNWVHWHLVPRYNKQGFNILTHKPIKIDDFKDVEKLNILLKKILTEN